MSCLNDVSHDWVLPRSPEQLQAAPLSIITHFIADTKLAMHTVNNCVPADAEAVFMFLLLYSITFFFMSDFTVYSF